MATPSTPQRTELPFPVGVLCRIRQGSNAPPIEVRILHPDTHIYPNCDTLRFKVEQGTQFYIMSVGDKSDPNSTQPPASSKDATYCIAFDLKIRVFASTPKKFDRESQAVVESKIENVDQFREKIFKSGEIVKVTTNHIYNKKHTLLRGTPLLLTGIGLSPKNQPLAGSTPDKRFYEATELTEVVEEFRLGNSTFERVPHRYLERC